MIGKLAVLAVLGFSMAGRAAAARPDTPAPITVMIQNMDDGTDQTFIVGALVQPPLLSLPEAVDLTYAELQASDLPGRAGRMAAEIAARKPEIVALQEASLWRFGATPETATTVLFDNVGLLVAALAAKGVAYEVVAWNRLTDLALPGDRIGGALRFTDRNAVLVRSDLRPPAFHVSNVHARTFGAAFSLAGLTIPSGWISLDVHRGNTRFRFVTTHLQSPIGGVPEATDVQVAQAQELIQELHNLAVPVVIGGDFNSDALHGGFVDDTTTVGVIEAAGYSETWPATHAAEPGPTWPFYLEDQFPPPFFVPFAPMERIDLLFSKGMEPLSSDRVVAPASLGATAPPFASDHAGVIAAFR